MPPPGSALCAPDDILLDPPSPSVKLVGKPSDSELYSGPLRMISCRTPPTGDTFIVVVMAPYLSQRVMFCWIIVPDTTGPVVALKMPGGTVI